MTHLPLQRPVGRWAAPILFALVAMPALAQVKHLPAAPPPAKAPPDISGAWAFKTDVLPNKGCVISGDITFKKTARPNVYTCSFVSREDCTRAEGNTFTQVKQSCAASYVDGEFRIDSNVDKILDAGPPDFKKEMLATSAYVADNFVVKPGKKDELTGLFHSLRECAVKFWRTVDLVS